MGLPKGQLVPGLLPSCSAPRDRAHNLGSPLPAASAMIIYHDCISQDEMFLDIYKIKKVTSSLSLEVEGKIVSWKEGEIDDALIGGNASAEGPEGDGTEATVVTIVDIIMNHHLQETSFT
ncbi:UNVERIFIED_CONTAM: hypothetical protein K2H54_066064 [Gekko kuhli]